MTIADDLIHDYYISKRKMTAYTTTEYIVSEDTLREMIEEASERVWDEAATYAWIRYGDGASQPGVPIRVTQAILDNPYRKKA